jgi:hypothetical protein
MTLNGLLEKSNAAANRRLDRHVEHVAAVLDSDLWPMLEEMGLLADLDAGKLRCHFSGVALSRENLGGIVSTSAGSRLIAESAILGDRGPVEG